MKKIWILILLIATVCLLSACQTTPPVDPQESETESLATETEEILETRTIFVDGQSAKKIPEKGNYVVYVKSEANEDFRTWNYDAWDTTIEDADATIYFFSVDKLYPSFVEMKKDAATLSVGAVVGTMSYHADTGRGAGVYEITAQKENAGSLIFATGKYATPKPFAVGGDKIITVDQLGARADGKTSDLAAIGNAFAMKDVTVIEFEGKDYVQTGKLLLSGVHDKLINGRGAVISNDYAKGTVIWQDVVIDGRTSNLTLKNITLRCTETEGKGTLFQNNDHVQLYIGRSDDITLDNVTIETPNNTTNDRHVTSIWIQDSCNNITIQNSKIVNLSKSTVGGGIWVSKSNNIKLLNNHIEKASHDEVLAIFNGNVDNVLIEGNFIYTHDEPNDRASAHAIGFGVNLESERAFLYTNIVFRENKVDVVAWKDAFMFGNVDGVEMCDNEIILRQNSAAQPVENAVFRVPDTTTVQKNVMIYNNIITVYNSKTIPLTESCDKGFDIFDNDVAFEKWTATE